MDFEGCGAEKDVGESGAEMRGRPAEEPWVPNSANTCFLPAAASGARAPGLDAVLVALRFTCVALPTPNRS